jgi:N-acetylglutamate synthase-like GNAT family acetyltransferase
MWEIAVELTIVPVRGAKALEKVRMLLLGEGLPVHNLGASPVSFFQAQTHSGAVVGWGGLEPYGSHAILRSVVVNSVLRGLGTGRTMVEALVAEARQQGLSHLWLLTQSAEGFFTKLGFDLVARDAAPAAIRLSEEFCELADTEASCMTKIL